MVAWTPMDQLINNSTHNIVIHNNRLKCSSCFSGFRLNDPMLRYWLHCKCSSAATNAAGEHTTVAIKPMPIPDNTIHIGNQCSHSSYRGLAYCSKCGARASQHMRLLALPCQPPSSGGHTFSGAYAMINLLPLSPHGLMAVYEVFHIGG